MYNLHDQLNKFYNEEVRLGSVRRGELAKFRDNSLKRLRTGLEILGEKRKRTYAFPTETRNQGGYAMHTLNQARDNDYDLDVALIFEEDDLPENPKSARERIRDAFIETSDRFKTPPDARTNAVTIWYASGQHLDFAIYRRSTGFLGFKTIEHASGDEWVERDPDAVTEWFKDQVDGHDPLFPIFANADKAQLRRIVRLIKFFSKSRASWSMPGGMIITILVSECFQSDYNRDDISLLKTLEVLSARLNSSTKVESPINGSDLTAREDRERQVEKLRDKLSEILPKLTILRASNCSEAEAMSAWWQFFKHDFWNVEIKKSAASLLAAPTMAPIAGHAFPAEARVPKKPQGFA